MVSEKIDSLVKNRMDFEKIKDRELNLSGMAKRKNIILVNRNY
jgi:hypothetical protein